MENDLIIAAERLLLVLAGRNLTLSIAESCTGGLICHAITSVAGASKVFHSGIVSYSEDSKLNLLGIDKSVIDSFGTISEEAAKAMAEAIMIKTNTDVSLSTTGNLGPEAIENKDVGLVYFAAGCRNKFVTERRLFNKGRCSNKYEAAMAGIEFLIKVVSENK